MNATRLLLAAVLAAIPCLIGNLACGKTTETSYVIYYDVSPAAMTVDWSEDRIGLYIGDPPQPAFYIGDPVGMPRQFKECSSDENE